MAAFTVLGSGMKKVFIKIKVEILVKISFDLYFCSIICRYLYWGTCGVLNVVINLDRSVRCSRVSASREMGINHIVFMVISVEFLIE